MNSTLCLREVKIRKSMLAVAFCALCGVIFLGCFDIENPKDGVTFQHRAKIHFSINATSPSNVKWTTTYTDENGQSKTVDIGQGGSFDYDGLPIVNGQITKHLIQAKRGSDHKEVTIYIKPWCMYPDANCSSITSGCVEGFCNNTTDKCETRNLQNGSICKSNEFCIDNSVCINNKCIGASFSCIENGHIQESSLDNYCSWYCGNLDFFGFLTSNANLGNNISTCISTCRTVEIELLDWTKTCMEDKLQNDKYGELHKCDFTNICGVACDWLFASSLCGSKVAFPGSSNYTTCIKQCNDISQDQINSLTACLSHAFQANQCAWGVECVENKMWPNVFSGDFDKPISIKIVGSVSNTEDIDQLFTNLKTKLEDSCKKIWGIDSNSKLNFINAYKLLSPEIALTQNDLNESTIKKLLQISDDENIPLPIKDTFWVLNFEQVDSETNHPVLGTMGTVYYNITTEQFSSTVEIMRIFSYNQMSESSAFEIANNLLQQEMSNATNVTHELFFMSRNQGVGVPYVRTLVEQINPTYSMYYIIRIEDGLGILEQTESYLQYLKEDITSTIFKDNPYRNPRPSADTLNGIYYANLGFPYHSKLYSFVYDPYLTYNPGNQQGGLFKIVSTDLNTSFSSVVTATNQSILNAEDICYIKTDFPTFSSDNYAPIVQFKCIGFNNACSNWLPNVFAFNKNTNEFYESSSDLQFCYNASRINASANVYYNLQYLLKQYDYFRPRNVGNDWVNGLTIELYQGIYSTSQGANSTRNDYDSNKKKIGISNNYKFISEISYDPNTGVANAEKQVYGSSGWDKQGLAHELGHYYLDKHYKSNFNQFFKGRWESAGIDEGFGSLILSLSQNNIIYNLYPYPSSHILTFPEDINSIFPRRTYFQGFDTAFNKNGLEPYQKNHLSLPADCSNVSNIYINWLQTNRSNCIESQTKNKQNAILYCNFKMPECKCSDSPILDDCKNDSSCPYEQYLECNVGGDGYRESNIFIGALWDTVSMMSNYRSPVLGKITQRFIFDTIDDILPGIDEFGNFLHKFIQKAYMHCSQSSDQWGCYIARNTNIFNMAFAKYHNVYESGQFKRPIIVAPAVISVNSSAYYPITFNYIYPGIYHDYLTIELTPCKDFNWANCLNTPAAKNWTFSAKAWDEQKTNFGRDIAAGYGEWTVPSVDWKEIADYLKDNNLTYLYYRAYYNAFSSIYTPNILIYSTEGFYPFICAI